MIPTLCISKDRPAQLDLLLQSLDKNADGLFDITVIRHASNKEYWDGYRILEKRWPKVKFIAELNCNEDFYTWLYKNTNTLTAFFTDDCIFYRPTDISEGELEDLFEKTDMWTYTFRLGDNITIQDYTRGNKTDKPYKFNYKFYSLLWDYTNIKSDHSFGWPCGLDGYIWRTNDLKRLLSNDNFNNFNDLEGLMVRKFTSNPPSQKLMGCPRQSCVFVQQINVVHNKPHNTIRKFNVSIAELNQQYLSGKFISLESMDFSGINCTHGEIEWKYQ